MDQYGVMQESRYSPSHPSRRGHVGLLPGGCQGFGNRSIPQGVGIFGVLNGNITRGNPLAQPHLGNGGVWCSPAIRTLMETTAIYYPSQHVPIKYIFASTVVVLRLGLVDKDRPRGWDILPQRQKQKQGHFIDQNLNWRRRPTYLTMPEQ
jgi:hypothetical protein